MRRPTGIDPTRLTPPRQVRPATPSPVEIAWFDGKPLPVTVVRPGIAVCPDPDAFDPALFDPEAESTNPQPEHELDAEDYVREIDFLLRRIESAESGRRLIEFLGHAQPLPDPDGSYGGPDDWESGVSKRALFRHRGSRKDGRTPKRPDLAGINVIVAQATDGAPVQWSLASSLPGPLYDGRGAFSIVQIHPRVLMLSDDVATAPEIVLAHELIHAAHALAGTLDDTGHDAAERDRIQQAAIAEAERLFREKYGTSYAVSRKNPDSVKVRGTGKSETHQEREAFYKATKRELSLRYSHPLPVAETDRGLVVLRGVNWEEIRTHGSDVALEWINGVVQQHNGRRISLSQAEVRSERVAFDHHARAVVRASRRDDDSLAALRSAAVTWQQRKQVRGVTEVTIARDLGFRHRIAYTPLTRLQGVHHLGVPRARIPHRVFAGASSFVYARDTSSLNALVTVLSPIDPPAAHGVWQHLSRLGAARLESGPLVEQRVCGRSPGRPVETSQPHWVSPDSVPAELRKEAGAIIHRSRFGTPAIERTPPGKITDMYPGKAVGTPVPRKGSVGFVAMVPAKVDDHGKLLKLARLYRDQAAAARKERALVIGLNEGYLYGASVGERAKLVTKQRSIIDKFVTAWQQEQDSFPVAVLSFLWRAPQGSTKLSDQKTIPYGAIRQTIADSERTQEFVKALYADGAGCEPIYLHTGDSDADSLRTPKGDPLFSAAETRLQGEKAREGKWPSLFSGGYRLSSDEPTVDIVTTMDRDVRIAMAKVDPTTVYFPEPNTFIKLPEGASLLEGGVNFGVGAQEGDTLAKSLGEHRAYDNTRVFDPECSIATDGTRLVKNIVDTPREEGKTVSEYILALRQSYTQSHARREEWSKRVLGSYGVRPDVAHALLDVLFSVPRDEALQNLTDLAVTDPKTFKKRVTTGREQQLFKQIDKQITEKIGAGVWKAYEGLLHDIVNNTHQALLGSYIYAYRRLTH